MNDLMTANFHEFQAFLDCIKVNDFLSLKSGIKVMMTMLTFQRCITRTLVVESYTILPLICVGEVH